VKRPTPKLWERQARIAGYRARERARAARPHGQHATRYVPPGELIVAPTKFDLTLGSGAEVIKFLRAVAARVLDAGLPVRLNFRNTETFMAPAAILLFAELDRVISLSTLPKPITLVDPFRRRPREVMKQIGLYELTGDKCDTVPAREDVVYWKTSKGATQSGDRLAILEAVAARANREHARHVEVSGIWRGVSEAVANVVDHAYLVPRADGFAGLPETKWWMFTQVRAPFFTAAVCDLGCGYRATVYRTVPATFFNSVRAAFRGSNPDALAIHAAMEYGRSGTSESHRGKGSRDALSLVAKHGEGEVVIMSNTGWMRYVYKNGARVAEQEGTLNIDVKGTIIWWKLPIAGVGSANG